jgi:hypothetical protein
MSTTIDAELRSLREENGRLKSAIAKDRNLQEFADADQALWHAEMELTTLRVVAAAARALVAWDWSDLLEESHHAEDVLKDVKALDEALSKVSQ